MDSQSTASATNEQTVTESQQPRSLAYAERGIRNGSISLTSPQTTIALLKLNAVVGLRGMVETVNGVELPSYFGDIINDIEFDAAPASAAIEIRITP